MRTSLKRLILGLGLGLGLAFLTSPVVAQDTAPPQPQATPAQGTVVVFHGQELFTVQAGLGAFSAKDRAKAVMDRLADLERNPFLPIPPLAIQEDGNITEVLAGDRILFTVTDADATAAGKPRAELAQARLTALQAMLEKQGPWNRIKSVLIAVLLTLLVTVGAWFAYRLVTRFFQAARRRIEATLVDKVARLKFQDFELLSRERAQGMLAFFARVVETAVLLVLGYIYLSIVFSLFPWTRGLAHQLLQLLLTPIVAAGKAIFAYLPNLFFLAVIVIGTRYTLKLIGMVFGAITDGKLRFASFHADWADPTLKLVRFLIVAFSLVLAFPYLPGSNSDAFKGVSLFVGVLFSLGSSTAMGNIVAGVMITYMRPFKVGDRIKIGETVGDVVERTALVTRIRTIKNVDVNVPNATVLGSEIHNFSTCAQDQGLILHTTVTIGYDAPWRTVHDLLINAALATEGILESPKPFVLQTSLDDFYVSYQINAFTNQPNRMAVIYSGLHSNIQEKFNEGGVEILSPHYRAERDGNQVTIPASYLPADYQAPAFLIRQVGKDSK